MLSAAPAVLATTSLAIGSLSLGMSVKNSQDIININSSKVIGPTISTIQALTRFGNDSGTSLLNSTLLLNDEGLLFQGSNQIDFSNANQFVFSGESFLLRASNSNIIVNSDTINLVATNVLANGSPILTSADFSEFVKGPVSSTDTAIARYNSTTGKLIENSTLLLSDNAILSANFNIIDLSNVDTINLIATHVQANGSDVLTSGDFSQFVQGPVSSTDTAIARYNSTTGKLIENSIVLLSNLGVLSANSNQIDLSVTNTINLIATNVQHNGINIGTVTNIATGTGLTGGPITSTGTISIANTSVTPASYTLTNLTVNAQGQITSASNGTAVTNIATGTGLTGGPITSTGTISIATTGVTATSYTNANITVNAQGQITTASNGTSGTVTNIATGTGLTGGPITSTGTISIANTTVTPASYTLTNLTVNAQGQITSASNGTAVTNIATGTGLTGGPITTTGTISIASTGVTATSYTNANITVNAQGQITTASNGTNGTVTSVAATTPSTGLTITGSPITTSGTLTFTLATSLQDTFGGGTFNLSVGKPAAVFGLGQQIVAIGDSVLQHNTNGTNLTAVGYHSLLANTDGFSNTAIGVNSLVANTTGSRNVCVGESTLATSILGAQNSVFGYQAAMNYTSDAICAFGFQAAFFSTSNADPFNTGSITAIGNTTLFNNTTGHGNVGVGLQVLNSNTTGIQNTGAGDFAIYWNDVGSNNTAVGFETCGGVSAEGVATMNNNSAFGATALGLATTGSQNCAFGASSLFTNVTGNGNSVFGFEAGKAYTTDTICAFGYQAALATTSIADPFTNGSITAMGYQSLVANTTGLGNTGIGFQALFSNTTGTINVGIGDFTLLWNDVGLNNTAVGGGACGGFLPGPAATMSNNSAFGAGALGSGITGSQNCAFGASALEAISVDNNNCAFGYSAGAAITSGASNCFFGAQSGNGVITSLTNCSLFGANTSVSNTVTNAAAFGAHANVAVDNAIVLGDSTIPTKVGIGRDDPQNILHTVGTVQLQGISSGFTGSGLLKSQNGLSTTAAGTSTLDFAISTSITNIVNVKSRIVVMNNSGLKAGYAETNAAAFWNGTTTASVGTLPTITFTTTAAYAVAAAWSISGNNLRLTVTGDAGGSDTWVVSSERFLTTHTAA
jgi:hypothetical protein